jgi:hypothetical protein
MPEASRRDALALADPKLTARALALLLCAAWLCIFARAPSVVLGGRIWGEEGRFLEAALSQSTLETLLWRFADVGYYVLPLNLCAALAAALPLELAPIVFASGGALALLSPLALAALDPGWCTRRRMLWLALVMLFAHPGVEVWLNVASAQFPIALGAAVLLLSTTGEGRSAALRLAALALAGLSGVASLLLTPLFALRAWLERSRARARQAAVLGLCLVLQLALMQSAPQAVERRSVGSALTLSGVVVSRQLLQFAVYPIDRFLGTRRVDMARVIDRASHLAGPGQVIVPALAGVFYAALFAAARRSKSSAGAWAIAGSVVLLLGSLAATRGPSERLIRPISAMRYFYAPNALLMIALAEFTRAENARRLRQWSVLALAWILLGGALEWTRREPYFFQRSDWYERVRAWREDPTQPIEHAPVGWRLRVPGSPSAGGGAP